MIRRARVLEWVLVALAVLSFASCRSDEEAEEEKMTTDAVIEEPPPPEPMSTSMGTDMGTDMTTDPTTSEPMGTDMNPGAAPQGAMLWNDGAREGESESWLSWVSAQGPSPRVLQAAASRQASLE